MQEIEGHEHFTTVVPILKGWSGDKKYYLETDEGRRLLLRLTNASAYEKKKEEFEIMQKVAALGIPMSQPLHYGLCRQATTVYTLLTWCDGEDAEQVLPRLDAKIQYSLGLRAGQILRRIHSLPAPANIEGWKTRFSRKARTKIKAYNNCGLELAGAHKFINYLNDNWDLLKERPQSLHHGDYHVGNMVVAPEGNRLSIIDFNRPDYGDPWEDFNRIVWSALVSPDFARGQIKGYFKADPPLKFFRLLAFYIASNTLSSLPWAIPFGKDEVTNMKGLAAHVLSWFDHMQNPIPCWYH